jgi:transposase
VFLARFEAASDRVDREGASRGRHGRRDRVGARARAGHGAEVERAIQGESGTRPSRGHPRPELGADGERDLAIGLSRRGTLAARFWSQAILKTLSIGKASAYAIANWERLTRFVENPLVPLDNNATERAIRGPVIGRKNHYGSKSRRGTQVAAILYSLVETAKIHDVDPAKYLLEAVRAAERGEILLPWQMAAVANQPAVKTGSGE